MVSPALLNELREVLYRSRIRRRWKVSEEGVAGLLELIGQTAIQVLLGQIPRVCRDPDDDIVLETAAVGRARYLVSRDDDIKGDSDLIAHLRTRGVEVISVARFLEILAALPSTSPTADGHP